MPEKVQKLCGSCKNWYKATAKQERGRCLKAAPKVSKDDKGKLAMTTKTDGRGCKKWEPKAATA